MKYLKTASFKNKTVLVRVDVNEPVDEHGKLLDDFRIKAILPTIKLLRDRNCKVILCGHLGRPDGAWDKHFSLKPIAHRLAELLKLKYTETDRAMTKYPTSHLVFFDGNIEDKSAAISIANMPQSNVILLENLRFYKGEEKNSTYFAKHLSRLADVYVNDGFAVSHRNSASVVAITKLLSSYVGLQLGDEIRNLSTVLKNPKHPFVVMMGGIKMADKVETLQHLGRHADKILMGGGLANLLLKAMGLNIGKSKIVEAELPLAKKLLRNFKTKIVLPKDVVVANLKHDKQSVKSIPVYKVKNSDLILDIGPQTILDYAEIIKSSKTLVWNGPMGLFEEKPFHTGTVALAHIVGSVGKRKSFCVVGGGETVTAIRQSHQTEYIDHLSTGGGAMLEYLAGNILPGIKALQ